MSNLIPYVRPVQSQGEIELLQKTAAEDNHPVLWPTHLALREGQIIGYATIGVPTFVNVWIDSKNREHPRDAMYLLNLVENVARAARPAPIVMPCSEESPFYKFMEKFGYARLGQTTLNTKALYVF